jgi:hypothetical protein
LAFTLQRQIAREVEMTTKSLFIANMDMNINNDGLVLPDNFRSDFQNYHEEHPWETIMAVRGCQLKVKALGIYYDEKYFLNWIPFFDILIL